MQKKIMIMPSLLAGDFGNREASARKAEACGGDALHMDIMDAHFVPNLSMGPDVVRMARRCLGIPLNVHLMMTHPHLYVRAFIEAGASTLLIHVEAQCDIRATLRQIRDLGAAPGLAINPETPVSALFPWLDEINEVLFMTVHPGFGGQEFMGEVVPSIAGLCRRLDGPGGARFQALDIAVDGGINLRTVEAAAAAGANAFVAGNALYTARDMARDAALMRSGAAAAFGRDVFPAA